MAGTQTFPTYVGQRVLIETVFRLNGVPTDPTVVLVTAKSPGGGQVTLTYPAAEFIRRDVGIFEASFLVADPGSWTFRVEGAGVVDAVNEMVLPVTASGVN